MHPSRPRRPLATALLAGALLAAPPARAAVELAWTEIGAPGNECDPQGNGCFGAVDDVFAISVFEITNAEYATFLNAVAQTDTYQLYRNNQSSSDDGGITRSGSSGSYQYTVKSGFADRPVVFVNWYAALRFANWIHNGMPTGPQDAATTEDGAYTFAGATSVGPRNPGARVFLPNEDEWYKAAYYDPALDLYFAYPAGSDGNTKCANPNGDDGNAANCNFAVGRSEEVGSYILSESPNGTFDQGGNAAEWLESGSGSNRVVRGGSWGSTYGFLGAANRSTTSPNGIWADIGFRLAQPVPAPSAGTLALGAVAALATLRRRADSALRRR